MSQIIAPGEALLLNALVTPTAEGIASRVLAKTSGGNLTFSGLLSGPAEGELNTAGNITLTAANTYGGPTNVRSGKLTVANNFTYSSEILVDSGTVLELAANGNRVIKTGSVTSLGGKLDLKDNNLVILEYDKALAVLTNTALQDTKLAQRSFEVLGSNGSAVLSQTQAVNLTAT